VTLLSAEINQFIRANVGQIELVGKASTIAAILLWEHLMGKTKKGSILGWVMAGVWVVLFVALAFVAFSKSKVTKILEKKVEKKDG
jgi:hypothetical protein